MKNLTKVESKVVTGGGMLATVADLMDMGGKILTTLGGGKEGKAPGGKKPSGGSGGSSKGKK